MRCGHLLCELAGGACSLTPGLSRGCRTGPRPRTAIEADVFEEVRALLGLLDPARLVAPLAPGPVRDAAVRLAAIIRREAREGRGVLAQAREDEPDLVPRLERLCKPR